MRDAVEQARRWTRPYTSMQRAWVDALGLAPSRMWGRGRVDHPDLRHRGARGAMRQDHGVRGL